MSAQKAKLQMPGALARGERVAQTLAEKDGEFEEFADWCKAAGGSVSSTRFRILWLLKEKIELSSGTLAEILEVNLANMSQHLYELKAAGLVIRKKDGQHRFYRLHREHPFVQGMLANLFPNEEPAEGTGAE